MTNDDDPIEPEIVYYPDYPDGSHKFQKGYDPRRKMNNAGHPVTLIPSRPGEVRNPYGRGGKELHDEKKQFRVDVRALIKAKALPAIEAAFDSDDVSPQEKAAIAIKVMEFGWGKAKPEADDDKEDKGPTPLERLVEALTEKG